MLVSVHDLKLARAYSSRIVGLQGGVKVLDDATATIDDETIESIYHVAADTFGEVSA